MARGIKRRDLKELREPDEFLTLSQRVLDWARANEKQATMAVVAFVVLVAAALGVRWYRGAQLKRAEAAFGKAYAEITAGQWESAASAFDAVAKGWPNTAPGRLALVFRANALVQAGKTSEAASAYQELLASAGRDDLLRQIALYNTGALEKEKGEASAVANLSRAAEIEGPFRAAAWMSRLATQESFEENASAGLKIVSELPTETRAYVESRMGAAAASKPAPQ